jgi:cytoskeletal protein CcmA (bactofilin family)
MLPNFRRTEPELNKIQSITPANEPAAAAFPARPFLAAAPRASERAVSMIGPDLTITGNLISKGEVQVDGVVEGDIQGSHVVIGETATITGGVIADEVVVRGHVVGTIRSKRVMLQATSQVEGDIYHQSLSIEQGALFEGKSRRSNDDPRASVPPRLPELAD